MNEKEFATKYKIFECLAGSHAYGTAIPGHSDVDKRGVFIAPPSHILTCIKSIEQVEAEGEDTVTFELRKFLKLAADNNPNIVELLATDPENILFINPAFKKIRDNIHLFLSKKAKFTFAGYAYSQLKRIKGHKKWIMLPKAEQSPKMGDYCRFISNCGHVIKDGVEIRHLAKDCFIAETFGTSQFRVYKSPTFFEDKLGFFTDDELQLRPINVADDILNERAEYQGFLTVDVERFKIDHNEWKQYWEWKNNRNVVRAELEEKYKYDTKHAMHLVRLLSMCKEILSEGVIKVKRPDADFLLRIRNGEFDYDWLIKWAEDTEKEINALYETSTLRYTADYEAIDNLYREVLLEYWDKHGLLRKNENELG